MAGSADVYELFANAHIQMLAMPDRTHWFTRRRADQVVHYTVESVGQVWIGDFLVPHVHWLAQHLDACLLVEFARQSFQQALARFDAAPWRGPDDGAAGTVKR